MLSSLDLNIEVIHCVMRESSQLPSNPQVKPQTRKLTHSIERRLLRINCDSLGVLQLVLSSSRRPNRSLNGDAVAKDVVLKRVAALVLELDSRLAPG
jgi:hypothetical protein